MERLRAARGWALGAALAAACSGSGPADEDQMGSGGGSTGTGGASAGTGGASAGTGGASGTPAPVAGGRFTYRLAESPTGAELWTTPVMRKLRPTDRAPEVDGDGLALAAARNEFEPALLVVGPGAGTLSATVAPFSTLGERQRVSLRVVGFVDGVGEQLDPLAAPVARSADAPTGLWLEVYVPDDAPAGSHTTTIELSVDGATTSVPVELRVFDVTLPSALGFDSQLNVSIAGLIPDGGDEEDAKTMLFEHRFTPASVAWPSGLGYQITWDSASNPARCASFYPEPDEGPEYSIGTLAPKYILGEGWNGVGFSTAMALQFVDNATPRPDTFCGVARGASHLGTPAYDAAWSAYLAALEGYLADNGMTDRVYWYAQNEPQDDADHELAAHLCRVARAAAPSLRIAVSDEPKPEIAEDPGGACGYDIWIAHVRAYQEGYAWERQRTHGEDVWFYSLDHDPEPYFNPTDLERSGMHQRIIPWAAWIHRIRGFAYYDFGRFFHGARPGVRAELFREGFEDYELLLLANGGQPPGVDEVLDVDTTVRSVAASMTSWARDEDAFLALRLELGAWVEGSRAEPPTLTIDGAGEPAAVYINFQDPAGEPLEEPLVIDGTQYLKVGWAPFDDELGYGFLGEFVQDSAIALAGFDAVDGFDVRQQSYLYDDYGRDNLFEVELAPGTYEITIGVGRPMRGYPGDPHNVVVEGVPVVDDEPTSDASPIIERTVTMPVTDGRLSVVFGGRSEATGGYAYTFLGWLSAVPVP